MSLFSKIFGDANARYIKALQPLVDRTNALEATYQPLTKEELFQTTAKLRERLAKGETLDDVLPDAFAAVREAARRTLGQRHYDVQLMGGIVLHRGSIAEMRTGEGKTLVATLPIYLNALAGEGAHLVTVNEYLARRDATWMGQVYAALGMTVAVIGHQSAYRYREPQVSAEEEATRDRGVRVDMDYLEAVTRREAYLADITYGTNNEFGFDYLRDNMAQRVADMVQRPLAFAIVDEVDSILIDEARTPLIISAPAEKPDELYRRFASLVRTLQRGQDYTVDEKLKAVTLTEEGMTRVEQALGTGNIYETQGLSTVHHLEQALRAHALYQKDKEYVVSPEGEIVIVDEFTGRMLPGRRFSEGLHQAIEAKENVQIQNESVTLATVTIQNYFRLYRKLSGMTGTAASAAEELFKIYKLDVVIVPTHQPIRRQDLPDRVFKTKRGKYQAVVEEVRRRHETGQPVLIGTASIDHNEELGEHLSAAGIPHQLLNAKNHEREATTIAQAGRWGAVTVATNMAGRGVDIILGGNPPDKAEAERVRAAGGLHVLGTERHEARRIDDQLRGRAGRQGDPGSSQFYLSLEDDLLRVFGSERLQSLFGTLKIPEDMPLESKLVTGSLAGAQKRVEGHNFDSRKHLVEYDDVINRHREAIYRRRRAVLAGEGLRDEVLKCLDEELAAMVAYFNTQVTEEHKPSATGFIQALRAVLPMDDAQAASYGKLFEDGETDELVAKLHEQAHAKYELVMAHVAGGPTPEAAAEAAADLERRILLHAIDTGWIHHLEAMDHMRAGIGLRGYGQRDPLVEYKEESRRMYHQLQDAIRGQVVRTVFTIGQSVPNLATPMAKADVVTSGPSETGEEQAQGQEVHGKDVAQFGHKVGRNDPCPCGSGKKYKKCHGQ